MVFEQQDLKIDAEGRYLYSVFRGSSNGLDSDGTREYVSGFEGVAVFEIDQRTGKLRTIQSLTPDCKWPRGCASSPDGRLRNTGIRTP